MRPSLQGLAILYSCDKYYAHSYIPFYAAILEPVRDTTKSVLEIGIGYEELMKPFVPKFVPGSSLKMWRDYFPNAKINGCDINMDAVRLITKEDRANRIENYYADQSDPLNLLGLVHVTGGEFDLVIDDGSHETKDQIISAKTLLPYMRRGGTYVIEDVREPGVIFETLEVMVHGAIRVHKFDKRPDDCLVVVRR